MPADQRRMIFLLAIAAAIIFAVGGVLYWTGHNVYPTGVHHKHAYLAWALAVGAVIVANFNRPVAGSRRRR